MEKDRLIVLFCCLMTALLHLYALKVSGLNPTTSAVSELHQSSSVLHTLVLVLCAVAQWLWPKHLLSLPSAWLASFLYFLSKLNALFILSLIVIFRVENPAMHTAMLSVIASFATIIMLGSCLLYRQSHTRKAQHHTRPSLSIDAVLCIVHLAAVATMILLVVIGLNLEASVVGAYQRTVGGVFMFWLLITVGLNGYSHPRQHLTDAK